MPSRLFRALVSALLVVLAVPTLVWAGGPRDHEKGFLLRMVLGGGGAGSKIESGGESLDFSGTGFVFDVAVGGTISPNLAIHGSFFGWSISDPDLEAKTDSASGTVSTSGNLTMSAFGAGVTYYFMPVNLYLSGNLGFGTLSGDGDIDGETDMGLALNVMVGKEWWLSNRWGLGVAGSFGYHSLPDKDVDEKWSGTNFALLLSATFN